MAVVKLLNVELLPFVPAVAEFGAPEPPAPTVIEYATPGINEAALR
jgi:hypothetical protein